MSKEDTLDKDCHPTILKKAKIKLPAMQDLANEAISYAFTGDWEKAIAINLQILKTNSKDTDALNRLARAYAETGNLANARLTAQKVLKIDTFNPIASKALEKWKGLKKGDTYTTKLVDPQKFLEEPGKTKLVTLLYPGSARLLAKLDSGDEIRLKTNSHRVCVVSSDGKYIGRLPDDLSARLKKLITIGNSYQAFVKSIYRSEIKIFIRETERAKSIITIPSFPTERIDYIPFTPPELVHKKEVLNEDDEE